MWKTVISKVYDFVRGRQRRKEAARKVEAKLKVARAEHESKVELKDQELEAVLSRGLGETWRDEYATVSVLSIFNIIVIGGLLESVFNYPDVLNGITVAVQVLTQVGVELDFLITAVVLAALGLSVWRKF